MATETEAQNSLTQTMIWIGLMIVVVGALAYYVA